MSEIPEAEILSEQYEWVPGPARLLAMACNLYHNTAPVVRPQSYYLDECLGQSDAEPILFFPELDIFEKSRVSSLPGTRLHEH